MRHAALGLVAFASILSTPASAEYPERPIKILVPYSVGSPTWLTAQRYAELLKPILGQPVIVENRASGSGTVGMLATLAAEPDGYTVGTVSSFLLEKNAHYDPSQLVFVSYMAGGSFFVLVVSASSPVTTLEELLKSKPKSYGWETPGGKRAGDALEKLTHIGATPVPYVGAGGKILQDIIGGRIEYSFLPGVNVQGGIANSTLRPLAVLDVKRSPHLPDVPTIGEALRAAGKPSYDPPVGRAGFVLPPGTPRHIAERLSQAVCLASKDPALRERLNASWGEAMCSTPEEFAEYARTLREE